MLNMCSQHTTRVNYSQSTHMYTKSLVLYVCSEHTTRVDYSQSTHMYLKSLVLIFKDLRFLVSSLKAKRPLIYSAGQPAKGQKGKNPIFCLENHGAWPTNSQVFLSVHYVGPLPLLDHLYYVWGFA